jgi:hypothetical protein
MTLRTSNTMYTSVLRTQVEVVPDESIEYRYIITDLLTDAVVAEVPFINVRYSCALIRFGSFEGSIPSIPATAHLNLYSSTLPGKRALYILRNGIAVWGGIIWTRSYDAVTRELQVTGSEFISYLYKRVLWAPLPPYLNTDIEWDICDVAADIVKMCMTDQKDVLFASDSKLDIINQYPVSTYGIRSISRTSGVVTYTTDEAHGLIPGQQVRIIGVEQSVGVSSSGFDTAFLVKAVPTENAFTVDLAGDDVATTSLRGMRTYDIIGYSTGMWNGTEATRELPNGYRTSSEEYLTPGTTIKAGVGTLWLAPDEDHDILLNDVATVNINTLDDMYFDSIKPIQFIYPDPSPYYVQYNLDLATWANTANSQWGTAAHFSTADQVQGTITVGPRVVSASFGPFTLQSNIGISTERVGKSDIMLKTLDPTEVIQTKFSTFGQVLESHANTYNAFDYRVDVEYDPVAKTFKKYLHVEPRVYSQVVNDADALNKFKASNRIFEYPGNIINLSIDESIETAATRVMYTGSGASTQAPYQMVANKGLLNTGDPAFGNWPLWDVSESGVTTIDENYLTMLAEQTLLETIPPVADFKITVNGSLYPSVISYKPGDWCGIVAPVDVFMQQRLDSDFETAGMSIIIRKINAYTVEVPNDKAFPETVDIELMVDYKVLERPITSTVATTKSGYWIGVVEGFNGTYASSCTDTAGNIYAIGESSVDTKAVLVKYDKTSAVTWSKMLSRPDTLTFNVAMSPTLQAPVVASTVLYSGIGDDGLTSQFDAAGAVTWAKRWNNAARQYSLSCVTVDITNHTVTGGFSVQSGGTIVGLVAKYTPEGSLYWQRLISLGTNIDSRVTGVSTDGENNVYVCLKVTTRSEVVGPPLVPAQIHTYVQKYNYNGVLVWERRLATSNYNYPTGIAALSDGGCYVVGDYLNGSDYNGYVVKYNTYGVAQWAKYIKDARTNHVRSVCVDSFGAAYILGDTQVDGANTKMFVVKMRTISTSAIILDPAYPSWDGEIVWRRMFFTNNTNPDIAGAIVLNDDTSFTITGYTIISVATMGSPQYNMPIIAKLPTNGRYMNTYAVGPTDPADPLYVHPPYIFSYTPNESLVIGSAGFTHEITSLVRLESTAIQIDAVLTAADIAGYAAKSIVYGI